MAKFTNRYYKCRGKCGENDPSQHHQGGFCKKCYKPTSQSKKSGVKNAQRV